MSQQPDLSPSPIPPRCAIPSGVVALIGGITQDRPIFGLYKNNQEIFIYGPPGDDLEEIDEDDEFYEYKIMEQNRKVFRHYLDMIRDLLPEVEFGKTRSAFLIQTKFRYAIKLKDMPALDQFLTCTPLGEMISEDEIEVTLWGGMSDRRGIWKTRGLPVDIFYAWDPSLFFVLDNAMHGYNYADGLDLTFKVYGHLVDRNHPERIVGLVSEAAWGRAVQPSDKHMIYAAISRLQERGCIYKACLTNRFLIAGSKVRLLELNSITRPDRNWNDPRSWEKLQMDEQRFHWNELGQLFTELDEFGPYGNNRLPLLHFTAKPDNSTVLSFDMGSPFSPISNTYSLHFMLHNDNKVRVARVTVLPDHPEEDTPHNPQYLSRVLPDYPEGDTPPSPQYLSRRPRLPLPSTTGRMTVSRAPSGVRLLSEFSGSRQLPHLRSDSRRRIILPEYPYSRQPRVHGVKNGRALTNSDDTITSY